MLDHIELHHVREPLAVPLERLLGLDPGAVEPAVDDPRSLVRTGWNSANASSVTAAVANGGPRGPRRAPGRRRRSRLPAPGGRPRPG
jgi:hypothetical protein